MTYWWLLVSISFFLGAVTYLASVKSKISAKEETKTKTIFISVIISAVLLLSGLFFSFVAVISVRNFLGPDSWYEASPFKELILFFLMGLGMLARVLTLAIEQRKKRQAKLAKGARNKVGIEIDKWDLVYPFLSSAIVFGAVMEIVGNSELAFPIVLLAFQNGFFWQTIIGKQEG